MLVCVLVPLVGYVAFLWWKHDPFGLMFGGREYSVSSAGDKDSRRRKRGTIATVVRECIIKCYNNYYCMCDTQHAGSVTA